MLHDPRDRFIVSLLLTVPVLLLTMEVQDLLGYSLAFPGDQLVLLLLSTFVYLYGGWPFLKGAAQELKVRSPGMMTLIAVAISVAYLYSAASVLGSGGSVFFRELATLIDIMLLGHWVEMRSVMGASRAPSDASPEERRSPPERKTAEVPNKLPSIAAFSAREGGRLRAGEPNAAGDEAEGLKTIEAELSCKPTNLFVGS